MEKDNKRIYRLGRVLVGILLLGALGYAIGYGLGWLGPTSPGRGGQQALVQVQRLDLAMNAFADELAGHPRSAAFEQLTDEYVRRVDSVLFLLRQQQEPGQNPLQTPLLQNALLAVASQHDFVPIKQAYDEHLRRYRPFLLDYGYNGQLAVSDTMIALDYAWMLLDSLNQQLLDTVAAHFPADYPFQELLGPLYHHYYQTFPEDSLPPVVAHMPSFAPNDPRALERDPVFLTREHLGLGLNYFLGADYPYPGNVPQYVRRLFTPEFLAPTVAERFTYMRQPEMRPTNQPTLVDYMIYRGIKLYAMQQWLPETPDSQLIAYSAAEMAWAEEYLPQVYGKLLEDFFSTNQQDYMRYLRPGPFTPGFNQEAAPARLGVYLGWRLVQAYMDKHPEVSLRELLNMTQGDYRRVFQQSGFKPQA